MFISLLKNANLQAEMLALHFGAKNGNIRQINKLSKTTGQSSVFNEI